MAGEAAARGDYKSYHVNVAASRLRLEGRRVLVVGCAQGHDCSLFIDLGANEVVGVDVGDHIGEDYKHSQVEYVQASAEAMPLPSDSFDLVFAYATLEHVPDIYSAFAEMCRAAKPGGFVYSAAAPLWCTRSGPHWGGAFDSEPWPHLRFEDDEVVDLGRRLRERFGDNQYYEERQIRYCLDPRFFNRRRAAEYVGACARLERVDLLQNSIDLESQQGADPVVVGSLLDKGYTVFDLFGLTHILTAARR